MNIRPTHAAAAVALTVLLAACAKRTGDAPTSDQMYDVVPYMDRQTGCQYLSTGQYHALTPRMDATGRQICGAKP